ncbi:glycosyltransferase family 39 protein [Aromatoleum toluolicum]|uniref:Glycosyltransferase RgtA/B/C/D-like domain-containing protein n=1 Tax=Aromatoleum toluolicum TaxID=90060 RepID=A0ABX1NBR3_9RHOO|nr:glycosyltransferase family 39 protein [Aromatoleum toluolicum]NMF96738.1 glycosyltransferase family 39 protein [Aromatoleum toluolicum]
MSDRAGYAAQPILTRDSASNARPAHGDVVANLLAGAWLDWVMVALALLACFATCLLTLRTVGGMEGPLSWSIAGILALIFLAPALARGGALAAAFALRLADIAGRIPVWQIVLAGAVLRGLWVTVFPAESGSDGAVYMGLASRLATDHTYEVAGTRAYWPVGYPLFLSLWVGMLGEGRVALLAANLFQYIVAAVGISRLAGVLAGPRAASLAALLFACWPNLVANTATAEKEMLIVTLLPWAFLAVVTLLKGAGGRWAALRGGLLLGLCILVQPSLQFLPLLAAVFLIALYRERLRALSHALLILVAATVAVAPWSLRNHLVFDRFVLVSTNGGENFYRANNPLATGGYTPVGEVDLSSFSESERDLRGKVLALAWIRAHPDDFATLGAEKLVRFMGDDAVGVYNTLKVGRDGREGGSVYAALKLVANLYWLVAWILLVAVVLSLIRRGASVAPIVRTPLWLWLYLLILHAVFESAGKYHVPVLWVLIVLLAGYAARLHELEDHAA